MNTTLIIQEKKSFGNTHLYPVNTLAKEFCLLLNTKTITNDNLSKIKAMGFTVEIQ